MNIFRKKKKEKKSNNTSFGTFNEDPPPSAVPPLSSSPISNEYVPYASPENLLRAESMAPSPSFSPSLPPPLSSPSFSPSHPLHSPSLAAPSSFGPTSSPSPNSNPSPKSSPSFSMAYFGVQLEELLKRQGERGLVPVLVDQTVSYLLNNDGFLIEGIFHIPGDNGLVQRIKQMLDKGERFDFGILKSMCQGSAPGEDIRVAATLLWLFLRQLPEPILTYDTFNTLVDSTQSGTMGTVVSALQELMPGLPPTNREVLRRVLPFLAKVVSHSYINKMTAVNISSIFSSCFLRPRVDSLGDEQARRNNNSASQITQVLVEFFSEIFENSSAKDDPSNSGKTFSSSSPDVTRRLLSSPPPTSLSNSETSRSSPPQSPELLRQPKRDNSPQLNRWKYQTFTHPSADKLRSSTTALPTAPPQRPHTPPISTYPPPSSQYPQPSPSSYPQPPLAAQQYTSSRLSFPNNATPAPDHSVPYLPTSSAPLPMPNFPSATFPTLSSTRIQEIIVSQETRFRDMLHILQAATHDIDKALANNASIGNQLASLDEVLQNEAEVLHNILEQEKEKAALYVM